MIQLETVWKKKRTSTNAVVHIPITELKKFNTCSVTSFLSSYTSYNNQVNSTIGPDLL